MDFGARILLCLVCLLPAGRASAVAQFDVTDFGAIGDGQTDDTHAFLKAWKALCASTQEFPSLIVPEGKTFYVQPLDFQGPCQSSKLHVKIDGEILAPKKEDWKMCADVWLTFSSVDNLTLNGTGKFIGQGASWWGLDDSRVENTTNPNAGLIGFDCQRPKSVRFRECKNLQLTGVQSINSAKSHFSIIGCDRANISGLYIEAPKRSPNTDGIDLSKASDIVIDNCTIATGDDCISVGGGIKNLTITNITCGPGHGISIGSLGRNGRHDTVEDVLVRGCNFTNVQNGARIKTWEGGSGHVKGIRYENVTLRDAKRPIIIDQNYCPHHQCKPTKPTNLEISNVTFSNFYGTTATLRAITLNCSNHGSGCTDVALENVTIRKGNISSKGYSDNDEDDDENEDEVYAYCKNAHGRATSTIPEVPCLEE